ncbi:Rossmann-like and DUF2520 domain-containing protein [Aquimarina mytili]|uniref:DUF2520 domain-containing protein n=1 Tax=Aquimarina mytili TaxID=874423 RepID=A0A937DBI6_9FLAO|nr:DUF2520 domain-containing protein [Aquimarina mytili]MBL0685782.1 DUF2520 domain-containing protein [Aquimarina mytili]
MIRVVLLGAGNVAQHLYTALCNQTSVEVIQCYNRKGSKLHPDQKKELVTNTLTELVDADIYILAISDDAIEEVSSNLPFTNRLVVHTSGSVPMDTIHSSNRKGVFYPLQTFSKDKTVDFSTIPFCLEAENEKDYNLLKELGVTLSQKLYKISSQQRNALHVSAVFVNNFTNHLFSIGNDICSDNDIPFEILHPLIRETADKIATMNPDNAQTGPAIRNDHKTINRHIKFLSDTTQKELYQTLTKAIQSKYGKKL